MIGDLTRLSTSAVGSSYIAADLQSIKKGTKNSHGEKNAQKLSL